jgi:pseudomonalisin/xanthomonalisin
LVAAGAASPAAFATGHQATTHPTATSTGALPGAAGLVVKGAVDRGAAHDVIRAVTVVLAPRHLTQLHARINSGAPALSHAAYMAAYAPSRGAVRTVSSWAGAHALTSTVPANRALVTLHGSQAAIGRALGVTFDRFSAPHSGRYVASVGTASVPSSVRAVVVAIGGLSTLDRLGVPRPATRSGATPAAGSVTYPTDYTPQDFWSLYNAPSSQTGSGQTVSIITEGDVSQPKKDLATFEQTYGLPSVAWNEINVGTPSTDTAGDDEWDLDSQYSTGFAPGVATLNDYNAPSLSNDDILAAVNRWVSDDSTPQASFSAGECDLLAFAAGFTTGLDTVLTEADAQGQSLFVSSGDNGSFCTAVVGENGVPAGVPDVEYPASSPEAIGVGGTTILGQGTEVAWYAGGGGLSLIESAPAWQTETLTATGNRGVPDVALDADPESGYDVIVGGSEEVIGGTSASAPAWNGIWARVEGAHSGSVPFAGPVLYNTEPASAFNDIVVGANGYGVAAPGWDDTTGLGTPDITALVANG